MKPALRWSLVAVAAIAMAAALFMSMKGVPQAAGYSGTDSSAHGWINLFRGTPDLEVKASASDSTALTSTERVDAGADPVRPPATDEIQLCGGTWVRATQDGTVEDEALWQVEKLRNSAISIVESLKRGSTEYERAAGIWLEGTLPGDLSMLPPVLPSCEKEPCPPPLQVKDESHAVQRLARIAATTTDPRVYALAFQACSRLSRSGSCALLSAEQWARLDPNNARPWLFVLGEAAERKDIAARNEALHRIASSSRIEDDLSAIPNAILDAAPSSDESLVVAAALVTRATVLASAMVMPYQSLFASCRDSKRDTNLAQTCSAAASVFTNSNNMMDRGIGIAIGRRLGWSMDKTDRQSAELHRLQAAMTIGLSQRADILIASCPEIRKELDVLRRRATLGEIDAAKEAAATEPVSEEERDRQTEFKRENRERREAEEGALEANRQTPELLLPVKQ